MHMSPEMPSCSELFAFEPADAARFRPLRIRRIVPLVPIGEVDLLHLVGRVQWPSDFPMAETIAAALREHGIPPAPPEEPGRNGNGRWHPIPGQGIDGRIDDYDVLVGTEQFIEDAGIPIAEPARTILAEHERDRWVSVLVAAFHRVGASKEIHGSLLGVLAVGSSPAEDRISDDREHSIYTHKDLPLAPPETSAAPDTATNGSGPAMGPTEPLAQAAPPPAALTSEEQAALTRTAASGGDAAVRFAPGPVQPTSRASIGSRFRLKSRRARQLALLACLACLSSIAGTISSCLSVGTDEAVIVQRFGRVVAVCGPGLHFRPLWPIETPTRLQPALIREARIGSQVSGNESPAGSAGERVSNLFLTADAALRVSGRVKFVVDDVEAFTFTVEDPDRLVAVTTEAALVEALAGRSALWVLGPERGVLAARLEDTVQQRLTALGTGIRIHGLALDEVSLPRGTTSIDVASAFHHMTLAETDKAASIRKTQAENDRTLAEARARAADRINAAEAERTRTVDAARTLAQRVQAHLQSFRENPAQVREQLILNLLLRDSSGRPKILVDPALSSKVQFMVGNVEPADSSPPRPESQTSAATRPAGGNP